FPGSIQVSKAPVNVPQPAGIDVNMNMEIKMEPDGGEMRLLEEGETLIGKLNAMEGEEVSNGDVSMTISRGEESVQVQVEEEEQDILEIDRPQLVEEGISPNGQASQATMTAKQAGKVRSPKKQEKPPKPAVVVTLVHGDILVVSGDVFE
ncbi:hypothetical protein H0H93_001950, partial [Arthromyces matolae]